MKKRILLFLLIIFICSIFLACAEKVFVQDVRGSRLQKLNAEGLKDSILIIDTRTNEEYKVKHIRNAINIPKAEIKDRIIEISDWLEKPIYVYAKDSDESFEAAKLFVKYGCKEIYNTEGLEEYTYELIRYNSVRGIKFEKMMAEPNTLIVDCRSLRAYKISHIRGAISIPFVYLDKNLDKLPRNMTILLYDSVGTAAERMANDLAIMGYAEVYASIDGVNEYPFVLVADDN